MRHLRYGFTLLEVLLVMGMVLILLSLIYTYISPIRKKENLLASQAYIRSVATELEARRNPLTGALPTTLTDCLQGFGEKPQSITSCTISYPDATRFVIEADLRGAAASRIRYEEGLLFTLP